MSGVDRPKLGLGIGWRPELALAIARRSDLGFVEVMAESLVADRRLPAPIEDLSRRGVTVIPHGVTLSLGSAEPPDPRRLSALASLAERLDAPLVSEHIAFVRAGGIETGHLLPVPRTREMVDVLVENIRAAKAALPVPLALENIAALMEWPEADLDEADFLSAVLEQADTPLLLDIENVYANARNHGYDALAFLDRIPLERLAYVHVAGGTVDNGLYHDTHTHPVPPAVFELLSSLAERVEVPGAMLERDGQYPPDPILHAELDGIASALARGNARRLANNGG